MEYDYFSPFFSMTINGVELDEKRRACIISIDMFESIQGSDGVTITLEDPDFLFIEDDIFITDSPVVVTLGINESIIRKTIKGYISAVDVDFPESGLPKLSIVCLDESHLMNRKSKERTWEGTTRPNVVESIAREYGYKFEVEPSYKFTTEDSIAQSGQTDIEFLESLAAEEKDPFYCKLVNGVIHYKKVPFNAEKVADLYYNVFPNEVVSFSPKITKENIKDDSTKKDISTSSKDIKSSTIDASNVDTDTTQGVIQGSPVSNSSDRPVEKERRIRLNKETGEFEEF